jgi:DNA-binding response OmpR family regulator
MKILIVDRDRLTTQLLQNRLEGDGHTVVAEQVRKDALNMVERENFEVVIIDPAPLPSARPMTLPLRWEQRTGYFYLLLMGHEAKPEEVIHCGMNDQILKPFDWQDVAKKLVNAQRLNDFMRRLCETEENRSSTLVFGKRAFYQLVLSALDRAYRYGEQAYLLKIDITNVEALGTGVQKAIDDTAAYLGKLHRRSDFLGHTDVSEYVLLLLRPAVNNEPQDAHDRFSIALREFRETYEGKVKPDYKVELWVLPSGEVAAESKI